MVPQRLKTERMPAVLLEPTGDAQLPFRLLGKRSSQAVSALSSRERGQAVIVLPPEKVLCRTMAMPLLSAAETRAMLAYDIDRLTPLPAETACFDYERLPDGSGIRLGVVPVGDIRALLATAQAHDIAPARIALLDHDGRPHFDFLAAIGASRSTGRGKVWLWGAVGLLFAVNIAVLILRDIHSVEQMRGAVEEQAPAGRTAIALRQRIEDEQARRIALVRMQRRYDPLPVLNAIGAALPAGAWVQRLSWNDAEVRLAGYNSGNADLIEALEQSPVLRDVREGDGDMTAQADGQAQPFDISATVVAAGNR